MKTQVIASNYTFVVEAFTSKFEHVCYFRIDQFTARPTATASQDILARAVNIHLNELHKRTGLNYGVLADGPTANVEATVKQFGWELS